MHWVNTPFSKDRAGTIKETRAGSSRQAGNLACVVDPASRFMKQLVPATCQRAQTG